MPAMSVGGLASGLDTNSIIAQLTALEQAKVTREIKKKENVQATLDKFKELQNRLGNLAQKAAALETPGRFNVFKATSNYDDYATISGKEGANAGQYELVVHQLASSTKVASKSLSAVNTSMEKEIDMVSESKATITISTSEAAQKADSTKKTVDVVINSSDTLKDIVNKINAAEGAGVTASIMTMANGDNRLVLTAVDTGTKGFSISDDSVNGGWSILEKLGILSSDNNTQQAASGNALLADGLAATETTKFDEINTVLNKATIKDGDVVGIYLPTDKGDGSGGWVTFELFKDEAGNKVSKTIGEVLGEINSALAGAGADITASINSCGEIVLKGNLNDDQNLGSTLKDVKLQIGTFDDVNQKFTEVKKDMGTFSSRNVFENVINEGKNAFYTLDGMSITSQSNSDDKTISGTVFTLKKVSKDGMEPIKLSLELDKDAIIGNITSFIDEFNALIKFIDENTKASVKEEKDEVTGQNRSTRTVGAFTGDTNISSLRENLRRMVTGTIDELTNKVENGYTTVYSSISRLGIITEKDGTLGVDREKLSKALTSDFEGVRRLFTSNWFSDTPGFSVGRVSKEANTGVYEINLGDLTVNGETASGVGNILTYNGISFETPSGTGTAKVTYVRGIASMLTNFVEKARNTVDGYYKQAEKTYQDRIDNIQKRVDELQVRVDNYNKRLVSQYASLERSMSNLQSQTANMMSALSSLSYK